MEIVDVHGVAAQIRLPPSLRQSTIRSGPAFAKVIGLTQYGGELGMAHRLTRREFGIGAGAATLAARGVGGRARAAGARTLRFVPQTDVQVLDPIWTTAYVTRHHGYLVFCTL